MRVVIEYWAKRCQEYSGKSNRTLSERTPWHNATLKRPVPVPAKNDKTAGNTEEYSNLLPRILLDGRGYAG